MFFGTDIVREGRGFSEIRKPESNIEKIKDDKDKDKSEAFKQIKPESGITDKEADAFWDKLFSDMEKENEAKNEAAVNESDCLDQLIESNYLEFVNEAAEKDPEVKKRVDFMNKCADYCVKFLKSRNLKASCEKFKMNGLNKKFIDGSSKTINIPINKSIFTGLPSLDKVEVGMYNWSPKLSGIISTGSDREKAAIGTYLTVTSAIKDNINDNSKELKALKITRSSEVFGYKITVGTEEELKAAEESNT